MGLRTSAAGVVFAVCLSACETPMSAPAAGLDRLLHQDWIAVTIAGVPIADTGRVTLAFSDGRVSGRGGCNHYSGPAEVGAGTLEIGALISTKMACTQPGVMRQESVYLNALQSARLYRFESGGTLVIATASGDIVYTGAPKQQRPEN